MNARRFLFSAALVATAIPLPAQDQRVHSSDLPAPVQRALTTASKGEPVKTIHRRVIDGRTVYDIEVERDNAINPRFRITEDGIVLAGTSRASSEAITDPPASYDGITIPSTLFDPATALNELPAAVRATVKKESAGRQIADIDRESWQGRTVYEVEFREPGLNPQLHVAEDGTVVRAEQKGGERVGTAIRSLFMGTQLSDTPPAVQETIRREGRDRAIRDIDVKTRNRQRVYEVEFDDVRTGFQIEIVEDGRILQDTRPDASSVKRG
jgi:uncharacterized membrane protein YkoI